MTVTQKANIVLSNKKTYAALRRLPRPSGERGKAVNKMSACPAHTLRTAEGCSQGSAGKLERLGGVWLMPEGQRQQNTSRMLNYQAKIGLVGCGGEATEVSSVEPGARTAIGTHWNFGTLGFPCQHHPASMVNFKKRWMQYGVMPKPAVRPRFSQPSGVSSCHVVDC